MSAADEDGEVTAPQLKGTLIHRCVLAAAGKWLSTEVMRQRRGSDGESVPMFVDEAGWMAQQLGGALRKGSQGRRRHKEMSWALIDPGGPYWSGHYDDFCSLDESDRDYVLEDLEYFSETVAEELVRCAGRDGWRAIRSEVEDPFSRLLTDATGRKQLNRRIDLLVDREEKLPLVIDLKTGEKMPDLVMAEKGIKEEYGSLVAEMTCRPVQCYALGLSFDGNIEWSPGIKAIRQRTRSRRKRADLR